MAKMSKAADARYDKKHGIKEGSKRDRALDKKRGIRDNGMGLRSAPGYKGK